jgi:uncharacterized protein (TIGR00297 family)
LLDLTLTLMYFFLVIAFALAAIILRTIDARGFLASVAVGVAIIYGGGVQWFIIVAVFFGLGVAFTLYKYGYKKRLGGAQEKGGARNWPNILANGGMASVFAICEFFHPGTAFAALFLGSIGTAAADTAATELGLLSKGQPRLIVHPKHEVPPGTSGGVSALGFAGAALASIVIGGMAWALGVLGGTAGLILVLALCFVGGMSGAVVDSVIGATIQRRGYCKVCMRQTESTVHCGEETVVTGGVPFVENNVVNLLATLAGAAAALAFWVLA